MARLVAFGCSFTYGHGLPDCAIGPHAGTTPSQHAWPALLADKLGRSVVNMSKPGAGNTEILWKLINFDFEPDDLCVIMWSYFTRSEFYMYTTDSDGIRLREDKHNPKLYIDEDVFLEHNIIANWLVMDHASRYLEDFNIKSYAYIGPRRVTDKVDAHSGAFYFKTNDKINVSNLDLSFSLNHCAVDTASDGRHHGIKSHKLIADSIHRRIYV